MKIVKIKMINFCSYPALVFDVADCGLALISGPTGSGKSTLLDAIAWVLYGETGKEGAADDVHSWDAAEPTVGTVEVLLPDTLLTVHRVRGSKSDLYWTEGTSESPVRGKDLKDTQKLLSSRLGTDYALFVIGSYLTQFSRADSFFVTSAKDRRSVLEKVADQEFPVKLAERASNARKDAKKEVDRLEKELAGVTGKIEVTKDNIQDAIVSETQWVFENIKKIQQLESKQASFEEDKARTIAIVSTDFARWKTRREAELRSYEGWFADDHWTQMLERAEKTLCELTDTKCPTCGGAQESADADTIRRVISDLNTQRFQDDRKRRQHEACAKQKNPYLSGLQQAQNQQNPHGEQIEALKAETNPHTKRLQDGQKALQTLKAKSDTLQASLTEVNALVASLTWLYDKSFEMRGLLMERVVAQIETATNVYLEKHFDAPIRVKFNLEDSDKLDVEITNNGHVCGFKSLSGGERTMLKLSFTLSLMRAAQDKAGIQFHQLFLDEPLAGLDPDLKVKAFGLFQELEQTYGSVFVIEHAPEFTTQFTNVYNVIKTDSRSEIKEAF